jgi:hypothetical protein
MTTYYVNNNAQLNGDHEVHTASCMYLPINKLYLGEFSNCADAVSKAKLTYWKSNGCFTCSRPCHTT